MKGLRDVKDEIDAGIESLERLWTISKDVKERRDLAFRVEKLKKALRHLETIPDDVYYGGAKGFFEAVTLALKNSRHRKQWAEVCAALREATEGRYGDT